MPVSPDPMTQMMDITWEGFKRVGEQIREIRTEQALSQHRLHQVARAAYNGATGSGKARLVSSLVQEEQVNGPGAQARVADMLKLTPGRISQLLKSDKNRRNGK